MGAKRNYHAGEAEGFITASHYHQHSTGLIDAAADDVEDFDAPAGARYAHILPTDGNIIVRIQTQNEDGVSPDAGSLRIPQGVTRELALPPQARLRIRGLGGAVQVNLVWVCVGPTI